MSFLRLHDISNQNSPIQETCQLLSTKFISMYGHEPIGFAYAPGRVNLIGEHIDYEGYSVLPMALDRYFVLIAMSVVPTTKTVNNDEDAVKVAHLHSDQFTSSSFSTNPTMPVQNENQHWTNYVHCGYKGAWLLHENKTDKAPIHGQPLNFLVTGNVPLASGLSSSSALVVASVLASLHGRRILMEEEDSARLSNSSSISNLTGEQIADMCRRAEQYIGTMGGGMDQTISCLGYTQLVHFHHETDELPISSTPITLPRQATFVVAESTTSSPKIETANERYNKRVVECMLASKVLGRKLGIPNYLCLTTLQQVQQQMQQNVSKNNMSSLGQMKDFVLEHFKSTLYTWDEILQELDIEGRVEETKNEWLCVFPHLTSPRIATGNRQNDNSTSTANMQLITMIGNVIREATIKGYALQARAQHVYTEAQRVLDFHRLCCTLQQTPADASKDDNRNSSSSSTIPKDEKEILQELGNLMNESHMSCCELYECSSIELDALTHTCRHYRYNGTSDVCYGSRLTGAGWGGSTVSLVADDQVTTFMKRLEKGGGEETLSHLNNSTNNKYCKRVFACKPGQRAMLLK